MAFLFNKLNFIRIIVVGLLLSFVFYAERNIFQTSEISDEDVVSSRSITETTLPVNEIWRISNIILPYSATLNMFASGGYVCVESYDNSRKLASLQMLNANSGEVLWRINDIPPVYSINMNQQKVFIAVSWEIRAYNLFDGELLWKSEHLPDYTNYIFHPTIKEKVLVYSVDASFGKRDQVLRYYNVKDGALEMIREEISPTEHLVFRLPDMDLWTGDNKFWKISRPENELQWEIDLPQRLRDFPILMNKTLFLSSGIFPKLQAININTGDQIWEYNEKLVSNIRLSQSILYAIQVDGDLVAIDPNTGREIGYVKFSPSRAETTSRTKAYWVATTDKNIFVYFGDSRELIAFSIDNP